MPLPSPKGLQDKDDFLSSCMSSDKMRSEFPDSKQRYAVCASQWKKAKASNEPIEIDLKEESSR